MTHGMTDLSECPSLEVGEVYEIHILSMDFEIRSIEASYRGMIGWYQNLPYEKAEVEIKYIGMFLEQVIFSSETSETSALYYFFVNGSEKAFDSHMPNFVKRIMKNE